MKTLLTMAPPAGDIKGPIRKAYAGASLKAEIDENTLVVTASTTGNPDRVGDVFFPGAFDKSAKGFVTDGFVSIGHDWDCLPIAMPKSCKENDGQLVCSATFHSTQEAQDARTVCKERLDAGKSVSVSIGCMPDYSDPDGVVWFETGADMITWATEKNYDLAQFDTRAIKKLGYCRGITKVSELFEFSIVGVGMNPKAKAIAAKSHQPGYARLAWTCGVCKAENDQVVEGDEQFKCAGCGNLPYQMGVTEDSFEPGDFVLVSRETGNRYGKVAYVSKRGGVSRNMGQDAHDAKPGDPAVQVSEWACVDGEWKETGIAIPANASELTKAAFPPEDPDAKTFDQQFGETLCSLDSTLARWEAIAEPRKALGDSHRQKLAALVSRLETIAAKSEPAPDAGHEDPTTDTDTAEKAARYRELKLRTLSLRAATPAERKS